VLAFTFCPFFVPFLENEKWAEMDDKLSFFKIFQKVAKIRQKLRLTH
jgi:hypothetical protein